MKKKLLISGVLLAVCAGALVGWRYAQADPAVPAAGLLGQIQVLSFGDLESFFQSDSDFEAAKLGDAFQEFSEVFQLVSVEMTDFALLSRSRNEAAFTFELAYASKDLGILRSASTLTAKRKNIFDRWLLEWTDTLPFADYGADARYSRQRVEPGRGDILDRNGRLLAGAGSLISVGVQPDRIAEPERLHSVLQEILGLESEYVRSQYEAPGVQGHWFVPLKTLTEEEFKEADQQLRPVPGIFFQRVEARTYPLKEAAAQLTGYVGEVSGEMMEAYPERDYLSGEAAGRAGLESNDDILRGLPGYLFYIEPPEGEKVLAAEKPIVQGENLELTLDWDLQAAAHQILEDQKGALAVLDAESGEILVLASSPSYDPNEFVRGISQRRWQELSGDPGQPLFNRPLQGLYAPGSTFKILTVAAALDLGLYEPESEFDDQGELVVEGNIIRNFQRQVFGPHSLHTAVTESINTTVAQVGLELGAENFEKYFRSWQLDQRLDLGLPNSAGRLGTPGRSKVACAWASIGQDQLAITPLQMARFFSVFANEGRLVTAHLIKTSEAAGFEQVIKSETAAEINNMLREVVLTGTGVEAQGTGLDLYAKTGTAETGSSQDHAWFAGHVEMPSGRKLAFALLVEEGGVGGQAAAPLLRDYLLRLQQ